MSFTLGVDLGTSHTVAMLRHPDGRTRPLLFDGRPLLPSAVFLDTAGRLHVGADALRLGSAEPGRLEPNPKRHVGATSVLLGGASVPVVDLFAALLGAVAREAVATAGLLPPAVLTYPAAWGAPRRQVLIDALGRAGWPAGTPLVPEPVAAARYFAEVLHRPVPVGSAVAVFDFGGGTLDVAVVRNEGHGRFTVPAAGGHDDLGGLDLDAALVEHLGKSLSGAEPQAWHALTAPATLAQWRARQQFRTDVCGAKEMLSRSTFAPVPIPGVEHVVQLTRDELEAAVDPLIRRAVGKAAAVLAASGVAPADLAGVFLVGGSSRVPMVARLLHAELGIAPIVLEQPELPVAEGAILAAAPATAPDPTPPITDTSPEPPAFLPPAPRAAAGETDDREYAEAVDPWAVAEAAALAAGGHAPYPGSPAPSFPAPSFPAPSFPAPSSPAPFDPAQSYPAAPVSAHPAAPVSGQPGSAGPVSPAATGATGATAGGAAPAPSTAGTGRGGSGRRPRAYAIIAAAVTVVVAVGAALAWSFWDGDRALAYRSLSSPQRIAPAVAVSSSWADAEVFGDRVYFASSDYDTGAVGVVAIDAGDKKPAWSSTAAGQVVAGTAGTPTRWRSMVALPVGVALFTETDSTTSKREMVVLGAGKGAVRWHRPLADDDDVYFGGDVAVIADHTEHRLLGLALTDGKVRWEQADPKTDSGTQTTVLLSTTPADLAGPATVAGRPLAPDYDGDPRIVQISADQSARVLDARTGKVLGSRPSVAGTNDEVIAHNGRLIVRESENAHRLVSYQLDRIGAGEPHVLYTAQGTDGQLSKVTPCGDDRICVIETAGYDAATAEVEAIDADKGGRLWHRARPGANFLAGVGEAVLAGTSSDTTLIDAGGAPVWTSTGAAARLNAGNVLEFNQPLSGSASDPALAGQHLGDAPVQLGPLSKVRSDTCSWNTSVLACVTDDDFVLQRFAK